tara:strand:+ start:206 stop:619 length:414 start_codon:yes stop_codon:yes gene_type:complete
MSRATADNVLTGDASAELMKCKADLAKLMNTKVAEIAAEIDQNTASEVQRLTQELEVSAKRHIEVEEAALQALDAAEEKLAATKKELGHIDQTLKQAQDRLKRLQRTMTPEKASTKKRKRMGKKRTKQKKRKRTRHR